MFETTPPQPAPDDCDEIAADIGSDLDDPVAGVVAVEMSRLVVRMCLAWAEPLISELASRESFLRQPGGPEVAIRLFAMRWFQRIDPEVYRQLRSSLPLTDIAAAQVRTEELLRAQFADIVGTAVSYLLSDCRTVAIQMTAVAVTMAGNEVRDGIAAIISECHSNGVEY